MTKVAVVVYDHERETSLGGDKGYEPLGALMIVGALLQAGIEAQLFARSLYRSLDELTLAIISWKPDFVGFSTMYCNLRASVELAEVLEEALGAPMIFGGWHTSGALEHFRQGHPYPDLWQFLLKPRRFGVFGEGILSYPELVWALSNGRNPENIAGVSYLGADNKLHLNARHQRISAADWPTIPYDQYPITSGRRTLISGQGCGNSCTYCQTPILYHGCHRLPPEAAARKVKEMTDNPDVHILWVADEDLTGDREWFLSFCQELTRVGMDRRVMSTFANAKDFKGEGGQRMIEAMAQANWDEVLIGIETPDPALLRNMHRSTGLDEVKRFCTMAIDAGIRTIGAMMVGYPDQTETELRGSLELVQDTVTLDRVYASFLMPLPGTPLYSACRDQDLIRTEVPLEDWTGIEPVIRAAIPPATLKAIRLEFIQHYLERKGIR